MTTMSGVRVVAGTARGRRLVAPEGDKVRPTTDRVREAVCNALGSMGAIDGARVVDLFAGSGALGIEALSRGADSVVFVEPDRHVRRAIEANLAATGFADDDRVRVAATDAERHLSACGPDTYDLAFADPPYAYDGWVALGVELDRVLSADGVIVVESDRPIDPPAGWDVFRQRHYGSTVVTVNVRSAVAPPLPGAEK